MAKKQTRRSPAMRSWAQDNVTHVAHMTHGDFYGSEQSVILPSHDTVKIVFRSGDGKETLLKGGLSLQAGEVIDSSCMSKKALTEFYAAQISDCKTKNILLSLHLKATMMKVSDPILFGHMVKEYYKDVFDKHQQLFDQIGVNPNNGIGDLYEKIKGNPAQAEVEKDILQCYSSRPGLAMVDSSKGWGNRIS